MAPYAPASRYLHRFDIPHDKDTVLTIRSYEKQDMRSKKGRVRRVVLYFVERPECLALNKPNGKAISALLGDEMDNWIGKKIALFVDASIQMYGMPLSGIRVRPHTVTKASTAMNFETRRCEHDL